MIDFDYWSPTYIAFGKGKESRTGELVRRFGGHKALLHYGGGSAVLGITAEGRFFEYSWPSSSPGTLAGMARPINSIFRIRL